MIILKDTKIPKGCFDCKLKLNGMCSILNKPASTSMQKIRYDDCPLMEVQCNKCKHYQGVHNVQGHAPCDYWQSGGVLWNDYCSNFEED